MNGSYLVFKIVVRGLIIVILFTFTAKEQERIERSSKYANQIVQDISTSCMGDIR